MVDTLIAAAAALAATSPAKALSVPTNDAPTSLKTGEHVRSAVQVERRRVARAAINSRNELASLKPLILRAKLESSLSDTKVLLEKAENQMLIGNREQAMLTLDGANLQLERARTDMKGNTNFVETFMELEQRESSLREKIGGEPAVQPLRPVKKDAVEPKADEKKDEAPVKPPKRDELPVG